MDMNENVTNTKKNEKKYTTAQKIFKESRDYFVILILFMLLILRGYWLALHSRDKFGSLLIVGIMALLSVQVFFNIGVVTNLIPNTGISLPFFSYGGTALMIQLAEMGIILSVSRQIPAPKND